jgi:Uma2 family endonuclease
MALEHKRNKKMSVEEFFELRESDPDVRYEYIDGYVYMMTGGSIRHAVIGSNLCRILGNLLEDKPCLVLNSDACVQLSETSYVCPDVTVSCDPRDQDYEDEDLQKKLRYPLLIVEVLSPGTQSHDRGIKFGLYKNCPTIQEYLVVETTSPQVQLYRREANDRWTIYILNLDANVELTSVDVRFPVAKIYQKTSFAQQQQG